MYTKKELLEKIKELHSLGYDDPKIASLLHTSSSNVGQKRHVLGLPSMRELKLINLGPEIIKLNKEGLSDLKISKILNLDHRRIQEYRKRMEIPSNMQYTLYKSKADRIKGYIIRNSKFMASRRNIDFNLTYKDFNLPTHCPLLGIKLTFGSETEGNHDSHASLDRIDNSKGYVPGNVMVISRLANAMKNSASFEQLSVFCERVSILLTYYKSQGALGDVTDIFPNTELYSET